MRAHLSIFAIWFAALATFAGDPQLPPQMSIEDRVIQAKLIVIGKFGPPGDTGRNVNTSVRVERVLFGSVLTNTILWVAYRSNGRLIPEILSRTEIPKPGSRWVFFLTDEGLKQPPGTNYFTRAIGRSQYAHDGLELATDEVVKQVQELVAKRRRSE